MTDQDLDAIEKRANAAAPGPWKWQQSYEIQRTETGVHWAIVNPQSQAEDRIASLALLLQHSLPNFFGKPTDQDPDLVFVAHARQDVPDLIAEVRFLKLLLRDLLQDTTAYHRGRQDENLRWRQTVAALIQASLPKPYPSPTVTLNKLLATMHPPDSAGIA